MADVYRFWVQTGTDGSEINLELQEEGDAHIPIPTKGQDAGTDSKIYITLKDVQNKTSARYRLDNPNQDNFEDNKEDIFDVKINEILGNLKEIRVYSDCSGDKQGWLLKDITVQKLPAGPKWLFDCGDWFCTHKLPGVNNYSDNEAIIKAVRIP